MSWRILGVISGFGLILALGIFWSWGLAGAILAIGLALAILAHVSTGLDFEMGYLTGELLPALCPTWSYGRDSHADNWPQLAWSYLSTLAFWLPVFIFYLILIVAFLGLVLIVAIFILLINIMNIEPQQPVH